MGVCAHLTMNKVSTNCGLTIGKIKTLIESFSICSKRTGFSIAQTGKTGTQGMLAIPQEKNKQVTIE